MKELVFGNLNFNIVNSYKVMRSRIDNGNTIVLFDDFSAKMFVRKTFLGAEIEFEIDNQDVSALKRIDVILIREYGNPSHIAHGCLKVWKQKGFYIVHGRDEKHYNVDVHIIKICFKKPYWFLLDYQHYKEYLDIINKACEKHDVEWSETIVVVDKRKMAFLETKCFQCFLSFGRNKFAFYSSEKKREAEGIRLVPFWNTTGKYKTMQELYELIDSFFSYLEEYDSDKKGRLNSEKHQV